MFGARDILWAAAVCLLLNLVVYYRPLWGARGFVHDEARDGFAITYDGHRFVNGQHIVSPLKAGGLHDPSKAAVMRRDVTIKAERMAWDGRHVEFVVRHSIMVDNGTPAGHDASQEVHLTLERSGSHWKYTSFRARGAQPLRNPDTHNPFATAAARVKGG